MVFNNQIIEMLKSRSGLSFDKAKDYELLCDSIFAETDRTIGVTTMKRLLGYISDERKTNEYTLNTIALYLGHKSWDDLSATLRIDSDWNFEDDIYYVDDLTPGMRLKAKYLNRTVVFEVIVFKDGNALKVIDAQNSSLKKNDVLILNQLKKGDILEAKTVYRGSDIGNYRTNGELTEVTIME